MVSNFDPVRVALEEVFTERVQHSMESRIIFVPLLWHHSPQKMVCITVSNQIDLRMIASSSPKLSSRSSLFTTSVSNSTRPIEHHELRSFEPPTTISMYVDWDA